MARNRSASAECAALQVAPGRIDIRGDRRRVAGPPVVPGEQLSKCVRAVEVRVHYGDSMTGAAQSGSRRFDRSQPCCPHAEGSQVLQPVEHPISWNSEVDQACDLVDTRTAVGLELRRYVVDGAE